jgi:hypothetical protein
MVCRIKCKSGASCVDKVIESRTKAQRYECSSGRQRSKRDLLKPKFPHASGLCRENRKKHCLIAKQLSDSRQRDGCEANSHFVKFIPWSIKRRIRRCLGTTIYQSLLPLMKRRKATESERPETGGRL